jgi:hypothetical protein
LRAGERSSEIRNIGCAGKPTEMKAGTADCQIRCFVGINLWAECGSPRRSGSGETNEEPAPWGEYDGRYGKVHKSVGVGGLDCSRNLPQQHSINGVAVIIRVGVQEDRDWRSVRRKSITNWRGANIIETVVIDSMPAWT